MFKVTTYYRVDGETREASRVLCELADLDKFMAHAPGSHVETVDRLVMISEPEELGDYRRVISVEQVR